MMISQNKIAVGCVVLSPYELLKGGAALRLDGGSEDLKEDSETDYYTKDTIGQFRNNIKDEMDTVFEAKGVDLNDGGIKLHQLQEVQMEYASDSNADGKQVYWHFHNSKQKLDGRYFYFQTWSYALHNGTWHEVWSKDNALVIKPDGTHEYKLGGSGKWVEGMSREDAEAIGISFGEQGHYSDVIGEVSEEMQAEFKNKIDLPALLSEPNKLWAIHRALQKTNNMGGVFAELEGREENEWTQEAGSNVDGDNLHVKWKFREGSHSNNDGSLSYYFEMVTYRFNDADQSWSELYSHDNELRLKEGADPEFRFGTYGNLRAWDTEDWIAECGGKFKEYHPEEHWFAMEEDVDTSVLANAEDDTSVLGNAQEDTSVLVNAEEDTSVLVNAEDDTSVFDNVPGNTDTSAVESAAMSDTNTVSNEGTGKNGTSCCDLLLPVFAFIIVLALVGCVITTCTKDSN